MAYVSEKDKMIAYLEPIWKAKKWNMNKLKTMPEYQVKAIYLKYQSKPQEVNKILKASKSEYEQLSFLDIV